MKHDDSVHESMLKVTKTLVEVFPDFLDESMDFEKVWEHASDVVKHYLVYETMEDLNHLNINSIQCIETDDTFIVQPNNKQQREHLEQWLISELVPYDDESAVVVDDEVVYTSSINYIILIPKYQF